MGPQWRSYEEWEIKGSLEVKCNAVGEGPDAVDKGCKAADGGNVFAGACIIDLGCKAVAGGNVFSGARVVDRDHDFDNGDEGVKDQGIALPNEHSDKTECPRLRLEFKLGVQGTVDVDTECRYTLLKMRILAFLHTNPTIHLI